jgi:glycosyltransferase involved in cell wall biosynthesis
MKAGIVSLKFNPAHISYIIAYSNLFKSIGVDAHLILDKQYSLFYNELKNNEIIYINCSHIKTFKDLKYDLFLLYNVALSNLKILSNSKRTGARSIYVFHEPFDGFNNLIHEGIDHITKWLMAYLISKAIIKMVDLVIVPSQYAYNLYMKNEFKHNKNVEIIPLIMTDEINRTLNIKEKQYFSYIGHAYKGHGFDLFLDFIKYAHSLNNKIRYQIATRTDLTNLLKRDQLLNYMVKSGYLKVNHGRPLSNEEINIAYNESLCIWNLYRRSTQSGVLPKAFMFGTPVLATNVGSSGEFIIDGFNGFILNKYDKNLIYLRVIEILSNLSVMSNNARNSFLRYFYWENYSEKFKQYVDMVSRKNIFSV